MNLKLTITLTVMLMILSFIGCEDQPETPGTAGSTVAEITGRVTDSQTNVPLANVSVGFISTDPAGITGSAVTAADGSFTIDLDLSGTDVTSVSGTLTIKKNGYKDQTPSVTTTVGKSTRVSPDPLSLQRDTTTTIGGGTTGGAAHSLAFVNLSSQQISVVGVGGTESAIITFEARDSLGFPINIDHKDTVTFELIGTPVTGPVANRAYVSPVSAITNASGRVATTVNSGTIAGVLQFIAKMRRSDGVLIQSTPVIITVNAGLPEQTHFSIGAERFNFAALHWLGRSDVITVLVGDRYSNPVKVNTAVYFNTTGGVVDASAFTNPDGFGTVSLFSGNPDPSDPTLSPPSLFGNGTGYAHVRSFTIGEGGVPVQDSIFVLFSGGATISAATYTVHIDSSAVDPCVSIPINISDENGNPLSQGTTVTVTTTFSPPDGTNWSVNATGLPTDPFDDFITRGPGKTDFTLRICDGTPGRTPAPMPFTVQISVSGLNGRTSIYINGDVGRQQ